MRVLIMLGAVLLSAACGSGGNSATGNGESAATGGTVGGAPLAADINVLMMGNSHTSFNSLPAMVAAMVQAATPGKTAVSVEAPGWMFLDERLGDAASLQLIRSRRWSVVVLQAQKYSTSGQFEYSTAEANALIRLAREAGALPVMFPEWPRRGVAETQRIYDLHATIASKTPACVAPVGQAWDLAQARHPGLALHAGDGNHAVPAGSFLTVLVIASAIIGKLPQDTPPLAQFGVDANTQAALRAIATETVQTISPRLHCPADRLVGQS